MNEYHSLPSSNMKIILILSFFFFIRFMEAGLLSLFDMEAKAALQRRDFLSMKQSQNNTIEKEGSLAVEGLEGTEADKEGKEVIEKDDEDNDAENSMEGEEVDEDCDCVDFDDTFGNETSLNETERVKRCGCGYGYGGCGCATPSSGGTKKKKKNGKVEYLKNNYYCFFQKSSSCHSLSLLQE